MPDIEKAIKGLQIERECVSRDCDRDCGKCDLVQDRDWLLSVYDDAIALLKEQPDVVLCKDCVKRPEERKTELNGKLYRYCELHRRFTTDDWYCADGTRAKEAKE